jgi:ADP-ribose pyrophosphatase
MKWKILSRQLAYQGYFRLECLQIRHSLYSGGWSEVLEREVVRRSDCVAVLPYDPVRDEVLLIEQFRVGAIDSQQGPWLIEIAVGLIEPGERREAVAHHETRDRTGCELLELQRICECYVFPGAFAEQVSLYIARADLGGVRDVYGLKAEGEDIRVSRVSAPEAFEMVASNVIVSAIPIIGLQWLQINHERIREQWT